MLLPRTTRTLSARHHAERILRDCWRRAGWDGVAACVSGDAPGSDSPSGLSRLLVRRIASDALGWRAQGLDADTYLTWNPYFSSAEEFLDFRASRMPAEVLLEVGRRVPRRRVPRGFSGCSVGRATIDWWREGWTSPSLLAACVRTGFEPVPYDDRTATELIDLLHMRHEVLL